MKKPQNLLTKMSAKEFFFFFGPLLVIYAIYYLFSTGFLVYTSLQKVSIALVNGKWVGLRNFELLLTDPRFLIALKNNFLFAGVAIGAGLTIGFLIAVLISSGTRGRSMLYTIFLLPTLMPLALIATVFRTSLEARMGALNETLRAIGLDAFALNWLIEPNLAIGVVCILFVYLIGLPIMYYVANLSTINTSLIEAAILDGAKTPRLMWEILFPLMKGTHRTIIISTLLTSFRAFDIVFFSTGGGPGGVTEITGTYVYGFSTSGSNVGYGSAAALIAMLAALLISLIQLRK
jgi:ABC-type sugar transport system permease subunit